MKTAVEFLVGELKQFSSLGPLNLGDWDILRNLEAKAKEMEEERIKKEREEAYKNGYANGQMDAFTK